jgi:Mce-associated membrane protein
MSLVDTDNLIEDVSSAASDDDADVDNTRSVTAEAEAEQAPARPSKAPRRVSVTLRTVIVTVVICLLTGAAGVLGWLYMGAQEKLDAQAREASNRQRAEEISADYAVNAADMDYQDFNTWKVKLVNGTSPELKDKLTKAADSMEQVLAPLQWKSTAKPLTAKVRSNAGGIYTVDSFVSVLTKTMQAPDGLQSTATYSITIDSNNDWQITDVGGIDSALGK